MPKRTLDVVNAQEQELWQEVSVTLMVSTQVEIAVLLALLALLTSA